jgi:hypothetical protein
MFYFHDHHHFIMIISFPHLAGRQYVHIKTSECKQLLLVRSQSQWHRRGQDIIMQ